MRHVIWPLLPIAAVFAARTALAGPGWPEAAVVGTALLGGAALLARAARRLADTRWAADLAVVGWALAVPGAVGAGPARLHVAGLLLFAGWTLVGAGRPWAWAAAGGLLGLAILAAPMLLLAVPLAAAYALWSGRPGRNGLNRTTWLLGGAAVTLGLLLWVPAARAALGGAALVDPGVVGLADLAGAWRLPHPGALVSMVSPGGTGLLWAAPWLALAVPGAVLALGRPARAGDAAWLLALLAAVLLGAAATGRPPGVWMALLPFLALLAAPALAWLRNQPGDLGPRLAGLAAGAVIASAPALWGAAAALPRGPAARWALVAALAVALAVPALLWPGRASGRGRVQAGVAAALGAAAVSGLRAWLG